jgi:uridine kinase
VILVAIAGGSGSGKSWLAAELERRLQPHAARLSLDDFYRDLAARPMAARAMVNFDAPGAIDWPLVEACLGQIRRGEAAWLPRYDFATHTRRPRRRRWEPRPIVLIEGLWPWWRAALRRHYALRVFRTGPDEVLFARRLKRDVAERARTPESVDRQWRRQVRPMYRRYVRPQMDSAHVVLPCEAPEWRLERLAARIRRLAGLA